MLALLLLAGCSPKPEPPQFFIQHSITRENGDTETWTFTGPELPHVATVPKEIAEE